MPGYNYEYAFSTDHIDMDISSKLFLKSNSIRWHYIFDRLASELPKLREFRFGSSSQWVPAKSPWHFSQVMLPASTVPWETEHDIESALFEEMYVIWDDWINNYYSTWFLEGYKEHARTGRRIDSWPDECLNRLEKYPDCEKEDSVALQTLLTTVKGR